MSTFSRMKTLLPRPLAPALFCALALILYVALRWPQLAARPVHADEGVQAFLTAKLLAGDGYTYDPADKHGPLLYYVSAVAAKICGHDAATVSIGFLRGTVAAVSGLLLFVVLWRARALLHGLAHVGIAGVIVACAPLAVIYQTYFVHEAWLAGLTWALWLALLRYAEEPSGVRAVGIGLLLGLMQATKETAPLHALAVAAPTLWLCRAALPEWRVRLRHAAIAAGVFAVVFVVFYSAFFTRWSGVADGLSTYAHYWERRGETAQHQPWFYYLQMLWPRTVGGVSWGEPLLLVLALAGAVRAFWVTRSEGWRSVVLTTLGLLVVYSANPYKTPWLLLTPYLGLCLLAAYALAELRWRWVTYVVLAVWAATSLRQLGEATGRRVADARNPYFCQPTSERLPELVRRLQGLVDAKPTLSVAVVSPDSAWPLPWHLRGLKTAGFFSTLPGEWTKYDVLILDSRIEAPALRAGEREELHGLRPNVLLRLRVRERETERR